MDISFFNENIINFSSNEFRMFKILSKTFSNITEFCNNNCIEKNNFTNDLNNIERECIINCTEKNMEMISFNLSIINNYKL